MCDRIATLVLVLILGALFCGCVTDDGDMPWASPQPWEGAPSIPGLNGQ
jgi:hypothetical protein